MTVAYLIPVLLAVIASAFWFSSARADRERENRRRELRGAAVRRRELRATRGIR